MMGLLLFSLSDVVVSRDTVVEYNPSVWFYSSCLATSGVEVLAFYLSSGIGGPLPLLISTASGAGGCLASSYSAYILTPTKEHKPKAFESAFKGGFMGGFVGLGAIITLKFLKVF
jgi:hypothetical protein